MMKRLVKLQKDSQGFTLVELMIVVAIIGILAAIAIPQFAAYRIRGYNASAQSDVKNLATAQSALFADWQRYGITFEIAAPFAAPAAAAAGPGALATGGNATLDGIAVTDAANVVRAIQIGIGNGVLLASDTNVAAAGLTVASTFIGIGKHTQGNTRYGVDGDTTNVYQDPVTLAVGAPLVAPAIASTAADDIAAIGVPWVVK